MLKILLMGFINRCIDNELFIKWLRDNYYFEWNLVNVIDYGIVCYYVKFFRVIGLFFVDFFNKKRIFILVCILILIEGVNINVKNVIIYDDCIIGRIKLDFFIFNNILGRSGRMFEYFVGIIYIIGNRLN